MLKIFASVSWESNVISLTLTQDQYNNIIKRLFSGSRQNEEKNNRRERGDNRLIVTDQIITELLPFFSRLDETFHHSFTARVCLLKALYASNHT